MLKYLGLTLSQIRDTLDEYDTNEAVAGLITARLDAVEREFHDLFKRLQALHDIRDDLVTLQSPDWQQFAATIENVQDQGSLVWQMVATKARILAVSFAVMGVSAVLVRLPIVGIILGCVAVFLLWLMLIRIPTVTTESVEYIRTPEEPSSEV